MKKQKCPAPHPWPGSNITRGSHIWFSGLGCAPPSHHRGEKHELSLQREISPDYNNSKFLSEEALSEAGPGRKNKRKPVYTVTVSQHCFKVSPNDTIFYAVYLCKKENTAHLSRLWCCCRIKTFSKSCHFYQA